MTRILRFLMTANSLAGQVRQAALAHRLALRQQHSAPVVERTRQWALAQRAAPGSALRKALEYVLKLWADPGHYLHQAALAAIQCAGTVTLPQRQD